MTTTNSGPRAAAVSTRPIGPIGTTARVVVGVALLGAIAVGQLRGDGLAWSAWLLGLVVLPAAVAAGQALWARHRPGRRLAVGPAGYAVNVAVALVLYVPQLLVPSLSVLLDAGLLFLGLSLLLAAVRGYAGCELLAVSNWLLRRDDQIGCVVLSPIDHVEGRRTSTHPV